MGTLVHSALSHDVVTHEAGHALVDGLLPDLYNAITPQSLAIHEALADLSALALTLLNEQIVFSIFAISGGHVDGAEALSRMAEEFGVNARRSLGATYLRSASNDRTLDAADRSLDKFGEPNAADRLDPYGPAEVLVGRDVPRIPPAVRRSERRDLGGPRGRRRRQIRDPGGAGCLGRRQARRPDGVPGPRSPAPWRDLHRRHRSGDHRRRRGQPWSGGRPQAARERARPTGRGGARPRSSTRRSMSRSPRAIGRPSGAPGG